MNRADGDSPRRVTASASGALPSQYKVGGIEMIEEYISKIMPGDVIAVTAIALGILAGVIIAVTAIITCAVRRYFERQMARTLIHELLDRGLPSPEVERLVMASAIESPEEIENLVEQHG